MLTDASALKELIPPLSLYSKVLNAATAALSPATNSQAGAEGRHTLSSPIPWRRNGLKYSAQEVYFDVIEEFGGIVDA
jgi:AP-3 complex subunit mu